MEERLRTGPSIRPASHRQKAAAGGAWLGSLVALGTLASSIRRKGAVGGAVDTVFDFIPYVSGVKNAAEIVRGRDFIADRAVRPAKVPRGLK